MHSSWGQIKIVGDKEKIMQCENRYYEADTGYMCWRTKEKCDVDRCAKVFAYKVAKNLEKEGIQCKNTKKTF